MRIDDILKAGEEILEKAGIGEAAIDAFYLLEHCFSISRARYFLCKKEEGGQAETKRYFELIEKRRQRIPLQHLTKEQVFMGHCFFVNEHVLIPRQDTETLVEELLPLAKGKRVLDLCTGSGCILISLALGAGLKRATGADISPQALKVAQENEKRLGAAAFVEDKTICWIETDLFHSIEEKFDLIVSNPPYIETAELERLQPEVRLHEPQEALDGKEDGLYFYRQIIQRAGEHLEKEGILAFEIGYDQGQAVCELMEAAGYRQVQLKQDLAGLDRIVIGRYSWGTDEGIKK